MSNFILTKAWQAKLCPTDKLVLISLADQANDEGWCWPSIASIEARTCLGRSTIFDSLNRLDSAGHLTRKARLGRSTYYQVHPIESAPMLIPTRPAAGPVRELDTTRPAGAPLPVRELDPEPSVEPSRNQIEGAQARHAVEAESSAGKKAKARSRGERLPASFLLTPERREAATKVGLHVSRVQVEFEKFTDHWAAAGGSNAVKRDWDAAWRNWCRRAIEMAPRAQPQPVKREAPTEAEIAEARKQAAMDNRRTLDRLIGTTTKGL